MQKLSTHFVDKVWGVDRLPAPFPHPSDERIGEVWFEPPAQLDSLLVKHIFASERLSVQSHPNDDQARAMGLGEAGKSECWVITAAEPGATIAVGFKEAIGTDEMRSSALDGSIVDKLVWHEVLPGDAFYIPAGTVHAIGGGVSLIEVQQNTDITFRLYDYGRPRELHLDQGLQVSLGAPYPDENRTRIEGDSGTLVDGPLFRLHYWRGGSSAPLPEMEDRPVLLIPYEGSLNVDGKELILGESAVVERLEGLEITGDGTLLIAQP